MRKREALRSFCRRHELKGTILLSPEGINLFVAGMPDDVEALLVYLQTMAPNLADMPVKRSYSDRRPFSRLLVKIKSEIITFRQAGIDPVAYTSPHLAPATLREWLDDGKQVVLVDVRNDYEIEVGTFRDALHCDLESFVEFTDGVEQIRAAQGSPDVPVVTFCTGGIRCERPLRILRLRFTECLPTRWRYPELF